MISLYPLLHPRSPMRTWMSQSRAAHLFLPGPSVAPGRGARVAHSPPRSSRSIESRVAHLFPPRYPRGTGLRAAHSPPQSPRSTGSRAAPLFPPRSLRSTRSRVTHLILPQLYHFPPQLLVSSVTVLTNVDTVVEEDIQKLS